MDKFFIYINHNEKYRENKKTFTCGLPQIFHLRIKPRKSKIFTDQGVSILIVITSHRF